MTRRERNMLTNRNTHAHGLRSCFGKGTVQTLKCDRFPISTHGRTQKAHLPEIHSRETVCSALLLAGKIMMRKALHSSLPRARTAHSDFSTTESHYFHQSRDSFAVRRSVGLCVCWCKQKHFLPLTVQCPSTCPNMYPDIRGRSSRALLLGARQLGCTPVP